jgi:sec-independent protein translocase protein TatA
VFGLGTGELFLILAIVLVIFGAGKLPEIGGALGRGIRSFKKEVSTDPPQPKRNQKNKNQMRPNSSIIWCFPKKRPFSHEGGLFFGNVVKSGDLF